MPPDSPPLLDAVHRLVTPESVEFEFVLAGLYSRFVAWLIDRLAILVIWIGALLLLSFLAAAISPGLVSAGSMVLYFLLDWGYGLAFEAAWAGQTPGKRAVGLRVLQESGVRLGFEQALLRNLARALDGFPFLYGVGGVVALLTQRQQRLGDLLAGTIVVRERRLAIPADLAHPDGQGAPPEPLLAQRSLRLGHEERALVLAAVARRNELSMDARLKLFGELSLRLEDSLALARPVHLSDEKWCQWVAASLVRRGAQLNQMPSDMAPP